jgi:hypothetical protein
LLSSFTLHYWNNVIYQGQDFITGLIKVGLNLKKSKQKTNIDQTLGDEVLLLWSPDHRVPSVASTHPASLKYTKNGQDTVPQNLLKTTIVHFRKASFFMLFGYLLCPSGIGGSEFAYAPPS